MSQTVIHTENLTKFYGKARGIIDVNIDVQQGEVFGFLGPNGAGKTTTIRLLMDFIRPTRGRATIFGLDTRKENRTIHNRIGYLPGELALYENLTGAEFLRYLSNLRGNKEWKFIEELAKRLDTNLTQPIHSLSHGNKQKIGLIQAFMHQPELLILDEPTIGLDPLIQQEFYHLINEFKTKSRTVFLSSHILPEVEKVCDRVGMIKEGRVIAVERVSTLKERALRRLEIHFADSVPKELFSSITGIRNLVVTNNILRCTIMGKIDTLIKALAKFEIVNLISQEPTLEEIFLAYYE